MVYISEGSLYFLPKLEWGTRASSEFILGQIRKHHCSQSEKEVKTCKANAFPVVSRGMETTRGRRSWKLALVSR